jgi:hypothetical protein
MFEVEQLDVALARLAGLDGGRANAATRARDRHAFVAHDWDAIRRLAAADFVLEDRGKRALVTGDVEAWIASMQFTSQPGWRPQSTLLGTFGDHIALDRVVCGVASPAATRSSSNASGFWKPTRTATCGR